MSLVSRLLSKYIVSETGCWEYTGGLNSGGYGNIWDDGCTRSAHIVSYEIHIGPVPKGLCVCHTCDNRKCINPEHLFCGTEQDNIDDMIAKGRDGFHGIKNGRALLTEEQVIEIKGLLNRKILTQEFIAYKFGVSRPTVAAIKSGRNWGAL